MKKILKTTTIPLSYLLFIIISASGQDFVNEKSQNINSKGSVSKKPLFEVFTSSTCIPCAAFVPDIDEVLTNNPGEYSVIKYQMDWPSPGDIYYTEDGGVRRDYYDVSAIPELFGNGTYESASGFGQEEFDDYVLDSTDLAINCSAFINDNFEVLIDVSIDSYGEYATGLIAHLVIIEKTTVNNTGSNGEVQFHDVMLAMLPGAEGTLLEAMNPGSQINFNETIDMTQTYMEQASDLAVVVFVQDDSDKSIIQSEMVDVEYIFDVFSSTFIVTDYLDNPINNAEIYLNNVGFSYTDYSGQTQYNGLLPGIYPYEIGAPGVLPTAGAIEIIDNNINEAVIVEIPVAILYDNFWYEISDEWTMIKVFPNYCNWELGKVKMGRKLGMLDEDIVLISPEIDMAQAGLLTFELGEASGSAGIILGTVDDPETPENFTEIITFEAATGWEEVTYDLSDYATTDSFLAFKFFGGQYTECWFDNVLLEFKSTGITDYHDSEWHVYPNPTSERLTIEGPNTINGIELYNMNGAKVSAIYSGGNKINLNTSSFVRGSYFIKIFTQNSIEIKKVILN